MLRILIVPFLLSSLVFANERVEENIKEKLLTPKQLQIYKEKKALLAKSQQKSLTIFYFVSASMGYEAISNFSHSLDKLKAQDVQVQGFAVLRGFPKDFKNYINNIVKQAKNTSAILKIHPFIFRHFNLKRVPAYAIAYCYKGENFSFKECDIHYLIHGDIALSDVFRRVGDVDSTYTQYYFKMIKPK